jgi:hypothetical protein
MCEAIPLVPNGLGLCVHDQGDDRLECAPAVQRARVLSGPPQLGTRSTHTGPLPPAVAQLYNVPESYQVRVVSRASGPFVNLWIRPGFSSPRC